MRENNIHFSGLNALRFLSAFAIIIYHSTGGFLDHYPSAIKMFNHNLQLGVDMFFMISGFLIVYLLLVEKTTHVRISLWKFYTRRILRIFPLYYLIVGLGYFLYHSSNPEIDFSKYLYFSGNFWMIGTNNWTVSILNPLWSLCIEEHFYLLIPCLLAIIPLNKANYLFISIIIASIIFRCYATLTVQYNWMTIYCHTLSRCDLIAIGGLLAYYYHKGVVMPKISAPYILMMVLYLGLIMTIVDTTDYSNMNYALFKKYLFVLPMFFIFISVVLNGYKSIRLQKIIDHPFVNYMGKISFGLYMYHSLIGDYVSKVAFINKSLPLKIVAVSCFTMLIATLSYELFERQILKLKGRFETVKTKV